VKRDLDERSWEARRGAARPRFPLSCVVKKFFEKSRETLRIVADDGVFFKKVIETRGSQAYTTREIDDDWLGALSAVALGTPANWLAIGETNR